MNFFLCFNIGLLTVNSALILILICKILETMDKMNSHSNSGEFDHGQIKRR